MDYKLINKHKRIKRIFLTAIILSLFTSWIPETNQRVSTAATTLSNPRIVTDSTMTSGQKVTWDCVWFGSYPQTEVTSKDSIYATLQNISGWNTSNDIIISGTKYHRMRKGDATYSIDSYASYYHWTDFTTYHYFKYEPIKWRVLNVSGSQAFLLADQALDNQRYNTINTDITWQNSSIRSWLNNNFKNMAFQLNEQNALLTREVENNDNLYYGTEAGNVTTDIIFLLSEGEIYDTIATGYGFKTSDSIEDEARRCKGTDYTYAMGAFRNTDVDGFYFRNCYWWLRSPGGYANRAAIVTQDGYVSRYGFDVGDDSGNAVRPALKLNISSSNLYSYAGTVCSDGTKNEVSGEKEENTSTTTESKPITTTATKPATTTTSKPSTTTVTTSIANKQGTLTSVKSPKKKAIQIKWKKVSGATHYQIYMSTSKNFKKGTFTKTYKGVKATAKNFQSSKKYYVKMRPISKKDSVVIYGRWSKVKNIKVK